MPFPSDSGTIPTDMVGTTLLANPTDDHSLAHRQIGTVVNNLSTALGTTGGTNMLGLFIDAAGEFAPSVNSTMVFQDVIAGGTANAMVIGTPAITGGTGNAMTFGTPAITGGTTTASLAIMGSAVYQGTNSGTVTLNLASANRHLINMPSTAGSLTLAVSNAVANQAFIVEILQGAGGSGTVGFFSTIRWTYSAAPTQTFTAAKKDTFGFLTTGAATFD